MRQLNDLPMEICILPKETQHAVYREVLQLLYLADQEFMPPLSSRNGTTQKYFSAAKSGDGILTYFENLKEQRFVVARENGKLLGFVSFRENYWCGEIPPEELPNIYISTLIVAPEARGKGVTGAMYQALLSAYYKENVFTRTWSSNAAHIRILEKFGFSRWLVLENHRGNGIDTVYFKKAAR